MTRERRQDPMNGGDHALALGSALFAVCVLYLLYRLIWG